MSDNVNVAVRIRPNLPHESKSNRVLLKKNKIFVGVRRKNVYGEYSTNTHTFNFDNVYSGSNQVEIMEHIGEDVIKNSMNDLNVCVFAYGQTGSGKTYTMLGDASAMDKVKRVRYTSDFLFEVYKPLFHIFPIELVAEIHRYIDRDLSTRGLIPRIVERLFEELEKKKTAYEVNVEFREIYNEKCRNLLVSKSAFYRPSDHGVRLSGGSCRVSNYHQVIDVLRCGMERRITKATKGNKVSSRSHAIFSIIYKSYDKSDLNRYIQKRINLVDLAGSEKYAKKNYKKERKKEGCFINKSLLELGRCLNVSYENSLKKKGKKKGKKRKKKKNEDFVPVRGSLLTHCLAGSLGGRSKIWMLSCVSPKEKDVMESLGTLRYARRCKMIQLNVEKNHFEDWTKELRKGFEVICTRLERRTHLKMKFERMERRGNRYTHSGEYSEMRGIMGEVNKRMKCHCLEIEKRLTSLGLEVVNDKLIDVLYQIAARYNAEEIAVILRSLDKEFGEYYFDYMELDQLR